MNFPLRAHVWRSLLLGASLLLGHSACNSHSAAPTVSRATTTTSIAAPTTQSLRDDLTYLASDELQGRGPRTPGLEMAAQFIAHRFEQLGLEPVPGNVASNSMSTSAPTTASVSPYFQTFLITMATHIDAQTVLHVNDKWLTLGEDFTVLSFSAQTPFAGDAVFVGYGITNADASYDDYANIDVKGKVVIVMRFEPRKADNTSRFADKGWSPHATLFSKASNAAKHGAVAMILVNPPGAALPQDSLLPFASEFIGQTASIPILHAKQDAIDRILNHAANPRDLKARATAIDQAGKPDSELLAGVKLDGQVLIGRETTAVHNVMGVLPGTGPHAEEYVVVGAHYDHLGLGGPGQIDPTSTGIFHGADDNASGTTAMLGIAQEMARAGPHDRSILFIAFTVEELGLVGSEHFVDNPPIPLDKITSMFNLDMVGRLRNQTLYVGGSGTAAEFGEIIKRAMAQAHLTVKSGGKSGIAPSDHMAFALKKIPVLFFFTGLHADYHRPSDTVDKINFDGIYELVEAAVGVIDELAAMPRPAFIPVGETHATTGPFSGSGSGGNRAQLGVVPDYASDSASTGVRITGTVPESPAATAGLKEGDVIIGFGDEQIDSLFDLSTVLSDAKPGDHVKIKFLRDGKEMSADVVLMERH